MEKNECFVGLELCSSAVKLIAGYLLNGQIYVLTSVKDKCTGITDGLIVEPEAVIKTVKNVINIASRNINMPITEVSLAIPAFNLTCIPDMGSTNTIDGNDIIRHVDTSNILTQLGKRKLGNPELKIIDIVPDTFILDNKEKYNEEPIGKVSQVLSLHATIYAINEKVLNSFTSCVNKAGYTVKNTVIAPYASSLYLSTLKIIPDNYILVDVGNSVTNISYVNHRNIIGSSRIYRFGSKTIINEVSEQFDIDLDVAEELVTTYGIDHNLNFETYIHEGITLDALSDCIMTSVISLTDSIKQVIKEVNSEVELPIVLIGGTSSLNSIKKVISNELEVDVLDYVMHTLGARDRSLVTTLGLIKYAAMQPKINEEETITIQVNRVNKKKNETYNFDEEL